MNHPPLTTRLFSTVLLAFVAASAGTGSFAGAAYAAGKTPARTIEQPAKAQQKNWKKGDKYSGKGAAVTDYRRYKLKEPPKAHRWVQDGNRYLLVATATGIIAAISGN